MPSSSAISAPSSSGVGRALALVGDDLGEHLAGELEVGLDRLGVDPRTLGREPVGDRQHRHVERLAAGRRDVVPDPAPAQRALVGHEAEHQVMAGERRLVVGEAPAGPQLGAELADHLGADPIVAAEADETVALGARLGLADVVQDRGEADPVAAAELVGERLGERRRDLVRRRSPA